RECPILDSLTSRTALFDIGVGGRRRHDDVRKALRDYEGGLYRTICRVLLKPELEALCSNSSPMPDRRTSPPVPRCVPGPRAGRNRINLLSDAQHRAPRAEALARM